MSATKTQAKAALGAAMAIAETIRELKEVPSGILYANVMGHMSFDVYQRVIEVLTNAGLVAQQPNHLLRWIGPEVTA